MNENDLNLKIYGISQNPNTKDYIVVYSNVYCEKCSNKYTDIANNWCNPCQINYLKNNFTNWTSGNEKIDDFIQEMQLKINYQSDIIFEWIPYNQFNKIKKTGKNNSITVYSAIWKDGPLHWNKSSGLTKKYTRNSNKEVTLKCLNNSQNSIEFILNEV